MIYLFFSTTLVSDNVHQDREVHNHLGEHYDKFQGSASDGMPQLFSYAELNDLIHYLNLPKDAAEVLGSRLNTKDMLSPETNFSWYRHLECDLTGHFSEDGSVVYCKDISGLISWFGVHYSASD
jgi:hypothetical protein